MGIPVVYAGGPMDLTGDELTHSHVLVTYKSNTRPR